MAYRTRWKECEMRGGDGQNALLTRCGYYLPWWLPSQKEKGMRYDRQRLRCISSCASWMYSRGGAKDGVSCDFVQRLALSIGRNSPVVAIRLSTESLDDFYRCFMNSDKTSSTRLWLLPKEDYISLSRTKGSNTHNFKQNFAAVAEVALWSILSYLGRLL